MHTEMRSTDSKGRISLPKAFANATVIIEQVSDTELWGARTPRRRSWLSR